MSAKIISPAIAEKKKYYPYDLEIGQIGVVLSLNKTRGLEIGDVIMRFYNGYVNLNNPFIDWAISSLECYTRIEIEPKRFGAKVEITTERGTMERGV